MVRPWSGKVLAAGIGKIRRLCAFNICSNLADKYLPDLPSQSQFVWQAHSEDSESLYSVLNQSLT